MKPNPSYLAMLLFLLCAAAFTHYLTNARASEAVPPHAALATFPEQLGAWKQVEVQTLTPGSIRELGADDFTSRTYENAQGAPVFLFIAYYASQRARSTYHSPQNCLPGAGWVLGAHRLQPLVHTLNANGQVINEYLIEKDGARMLALYWYHGRGRVVASEYWGRLYTLADAVTRGRTDGALVRLILPLSAQFNEVQARQEGLALARDLMAVLPSFIPD